MTNKERPWQLSNKIECCTNDSDPRKNYSLHFCINMRNNAVSMFIATLLKVNTTETDLEMYSRVQLSAVGWMFRVVARVFSVAARMF